MRPSGRPTREPRPGNRGLRPGFSLVESLIALSILALVFTAIASAIGAGTASAGETRSRVTATLAAEELLAEVLAEEWDDLTDWHGFSEPVGAARAPDGREAPALKNMARSALVIEEVRLLEPAGIEVSGRTVVIEVHDRDQRRLTRLERFVPGARENES